MEKLIPAIEKINRECNNGGISKNPYELDKVVKKDEYVVYKKWNSSGYSGGNCWDSPASYYDGESEPNFEALDKILEIICPKIILTI